jgi:hypothetical protein
LSPLRRASLGNSFDQLLGIAGVTLGLGLLVRGAPLTSAVLPHFQKLKLLILSVLAEFVFSFLLF